MKKKLTKVAAKTIIHETNTEKAAQFLQALHLQVETIGKMRGVEGGAIHTKEIRPDITETTMENETAHTAIHQMTVTMRNQIASTMTELAVAPKTASRVEKVLKVRRVTSIDLKRSPAKSPTSIRRLHRLKVVIIHRIAIAMTRNTRRKRNGAKNRDLDLNFRWFITIFFVVRFLNSHFCLTI